MLHLIAELCARKTRWQYCIFIFALFPALLVLNSCGSGSTAAAPSISVSCINSSVTVNGQLQCTAAVLNLSSTLVNWSVTGSPGEGTIDISSGLYTAPSCVPAVSGCPGTGNVVTINAAAQADTSLIGTTTVTITPAVAIFGVTATATTVAAGSSPQFTALQAAGQPYTNGGINWFVNDGATCPTPSAALPGNAVLEGNATLGEFKTTNAIAVYQPPPIPPAGGVVTITAQSIINPQETYCLQITLTFGNASLQGSFAFSTRGRVSATNGVFARAGSFTADGNGGLIGGIEDVNPQPSGISQKPIPFVGTYNITGDGRGTMQICEGSSSSSPASCTAPTSFFRIVADSAHQQVPTVFSAQHVQMIESGSPSATSVGSGAADLQDVSSFTTSSLNGNYTFGFAGLAAGTPQSEVGEFTAGGSGQITSGELDVNSGGTLSQLQILNTSTYAIAGNGRGTATVATSGGTFNFTFYMVSAGRAKFIETDASPVLVGDAFAQQSIVAFGNGALATDIAYAFGTSGTGPSGGIADLVSFTSDGAGNILAGTGTLDQNSGGTASSSSSLGGTYTIDNSGRGTFSISGHTFVFYMVSSSQALIQETTSGVVASGSLIQQLGGAFTTASLDGSYALNLSGQNTTPREEDLVGQLSANGTGNVTAGTLDINNFGVTQTVTPNIGTYIPVPVGSGRGTMLLNPTRNLVLYRASPTQFLVLDTDTAGDALGFLNQQF